MGIDDQRDEMERGLKAGDALREARAKALQGEITPKVLSEVTADALREAQEEVATLKAQVAHLSTILGQTGGDQQVSDSPPGQGIITVFPGAQDITVAAMSNRAVRVADVAGRGGWELDPLVALDLGQRIIAMAGYWFAQDAAQGAVNAKPKLSLIHGLKLPKGS